MRAKPMPPGSDVESRGSCGRGGSDHRRHAAVRAVRKKDDVVRRPTDSGAFEFAVVSSLRAAQLIRGCTPRVESTHKVIMTAQLEVAAGKVARVQLLALVGILDHV